MHPKSTFGGFFFFLEDKVCDVLVPFPGKAYTQRGLYLRLCLFTSILGVRMHAEEHGYRCRHVPRGLMHGHLCSVNTSIPKFDTIFLKS